MIGGKLNLPPNKEADNGPVAKKSPIIWQTTKPGETVDSKSGKKISLLGQSTTGKSILMLNHGFYNSDYLDMIRKAEKFPYVVKALQGGYLPEINEILILESENNLSNALNTPNTIENTLFKPFLKKNIITIIPYIITDQGRVIRNGKIIDLSRENIDEIKTELKEKIMELSDMTSENTLYGIDSGTKVKSIFDKGLKKIVDLVQNRANASIEGIDKFSQLFYGDRNIEWGDMYEHLRGFRGWQISTFKEKETPKWVLKKEPGTAEESTKWVNGTEFYMDIVWRIRKFANNERTVEPVFSRNLPTDIERLKPFRIPLESRYGAMPLLDRICEKMVEYDEAPDEAFWKL